MQLQDFLIAAAIGMAAGLHTATWGMYKDAIHEGFFWPRYFRSPMVGIVMALIAYAIARPDLGTAAGQVAFFGVTYVLERGVIELWKTFLRNEDQGKYFIPMQFAVFGRVVHSQAQRLRHRRDHDGGRVRHVPRGALQRAGAAAGELGAGWSCLDRQHQRLDFRVSRRLEGRAGRGVPAVQVRSQSAVGRVLGFAGGALHVEHPRRHDGRAGFHDLHARNLQDILLPVQAAREVRGKTHPVSGRC